MSKQIQLDLSSASARSVGQALRHAAPRRTNQERKQRRYDLRRERSDSKLHQKDSPARSRGFEKQPSSNLTERRGDTADQHLSLSGRVAGNDVDMESVFVGQVEGEMISTEIEPNIDEPYTSSNGPLRLDQEFIDQQGAVAEQSAIDEEPQKAPSVRRYSDHQGNLPKRLDTSMLLYNCFPDNLLKEWGWTNWRWRKVHSLLFPSFVRERSGYEVSNNDSTEAAFGENATLPDWLYKAVSRFHFDIFIRANRERGKPVGPGELHRIVTNHDIRTWIEDLGGSVPLDVSSWNGQLTDAKAPDQSTFTAGSSAAPLEPPRLRQTDVSDPTASTFSFSKWLRSQSSEGSTILHRTDGKWGAEPVLDDDKKHRRGASMNHGLWGGSDFRLREV